MLPERLVAALVAGAARGRLLDHERYLVAALGDRGRRVGGEERGGDLVVGVAVAEIGPGAGRRQQAVAGLQLGRPQPVGVGDAGTAVLALPALVAPLDPAALQGLEDGRMLVGGLLQR